MANTDRVGVRQNGDFMKQNKSNVKVKICGVKTESEVALLNKLLPDYIGFIFADGTHKVDELTAKRLSLKTDSAIAKVGVFYRQNAEFVFNIAKSGIVDIVQMTDELDEHMAMSLKALPVKLIKTVRVKSDGGLLTDRLMTYNQINERYGKLYDYYLLDTFSDKKAGGTGEFINIKTLPPLNKPIFVAGGLNEFNVEKIIALNPYGVDACSGVESQGAKDRDLVERFIAKARLV